MLSHTLDAVTGIKVDYALEVRITFIPVAPVQLKPHWMDHIALIHRYNLWTGPFSRLMNKQTLSPNGHFTGVTQTYLFELSSGFESYPVQSLRLFLVKLRKRTQPSFL